MWGRENTATSTIDFFGASISRAICSMQLEKELTSSRGWAFSIHDFKPSCTQASPRRDGRRGQGPILETLSQMCPYNPRSGHSQHPASAGKCAHPACPGLSQLRLVV